MNMSTEVNELFESISKFREVVKQPLKNANNPFFKSKYAPIESVVKSIDEGIKGLGLSYTQWAINEDNKVGIVTMIMHKSGQWMKTDPFSVVPSKNDIQGAGAVMTYLRRYALSAAFGLAADEDTDGNDDVNQRNIEQQKKQQSVGKIAIPTTAQEGAAIVMPFGKFKGKSLRELFYSKDSKERGYLTWLLEQESTDEAFKTAISLMQVAAAQAEANKKMEQ